MRLALGLLSFGVFAALAGCQSEHPSIGIGREVTVEPLDAGRDSARFRASVVSGGKYSSLEYFSALLNAGGQACSPRTLTVKDQSPEFGAGAFEVVPAAGTTMTMTVACRHDSIPGHRLVTDAEAEEKILHAPVPSGSDDKTAYRSMRKDETRLETAEGLIGGFVREAYTEDCAGRGLVVEKMELASAPVDPASGTPYVEKMHAVMHFRCMDVAPDATQDANAISD